MSAQVHKGWRKVGSGTAAFPAIRGQLGTHAFAIVGYDHGGFWLQNSKGPDWGEGGFGYLSNTDWARNGLDAWVAHLWTGSRRGLEQSLLSRLQERVEVK